MRLGKSSLVATVYLLAMSGRAAITLTPLFSFNGTNGMYPLALIRGTNGDLYGTARFGGIGFSDTSAGNGTVFRLTQDGAFSNLFLLDGNNGWSNPAFLMKTTDGSFYGTILGGDGAVFMMTSDGALTNYNSVPFGWPDGINPVWLVEGHDGNLYGVTEFGGGPTSTAGTVFGIGTNGTLNTLAAFGGTNGSHPVTLLQSADGNFYGVTHDGGQLELGTVFKMTPDNTLTAIASFDGTNGMTPNWLLRSSDGNLYGTTMFGGVSFTNGYLMSYGTVFKMTTNGALLWSFSFNGTNGSSPSVLIQGTDGNLYGTTDRGGIGFDGSDGGNGTIFRITPDGTFASLLLFDGTNGSQPFFLLEDPDGSFYGTTTMGGTSGQGTIFRLSVPMPPVFQKPTRTSGALTLTWSAVAGQTYQLQYNSKLNSTNWVNLGSSVLATNGVMSASDSIGPDSQRTYRVVLLP